ncbi:MAG TPA: M28 family peptidase, partial [Ferruginibacter sp.]|nr:M28 family peptidase [Ferruginibacter sp.]
MKKLLLLSVLLFGYTLTFAQDIDKIITVSEVTRIEKMLASDEMQGRKTFSPGIEKAASFISGEFKKAGLVFFDGLKDYLQPFSMIKTKFISAGGNMDNIPVDANDIIAITTDTLLRINENSGYTKVTWDTSVKLMAEASKLIRADKNYLVLINKLQAKNFGNIKRFKRESFPRKGNVIFVLTDNDPAKYNFYITHQITASSLANVVGVLPGKSKKEELVIFSAHYDHLGIGKSNAAMDSVYNGANDDAAGT